MRVRVYVCVREQVKQAALRCVIDAHFRFIGNSTTAVIARSPLSISGFLLLGYCVVIGKCNGKIHEIRNLFVFFWIWFYLCLSFYFLQMAAPAAPAPALKDLPKVAENLKSQLEGFNTEKLKNAATQEKIILPTAEGT